MELALPSACKDLQRLTGSGSAFAEANAVAGKDSPEAS